MIHDADTLFADLRGLMQRDLLDSRAHARLRLLLRASHSLDPVAHAERIVPYVSGFPRHLEPPLSTVESAFQLDLAAKIAPSATFTLGEHFTAAEVAALRQGPHAARVSGVVVSLDEPGRLLELAAHAEELPRLTRLDFRRAGPTPAQVTALLNSPLHGRLTHLSLPKGSAQDQARVLIASGRFEHLTHLSIHDARLDHRLIETLPLELIEHLDLSGCHIGDDGLRELVRHDMPGLERLDLSGNRIGPAGVRALTLADLTALTHLVLDDNPLGEAGLRAIATCRWIKRVSHLGLRSIHGAGPFTLDQVDAPALMHALLVGAPFETSSLDLSDNVLDARAATALAKSPAFSRLRRLDLSGNDPAARGVQAISNSPHLADLEHLSLSRCGLQRDSIGALARGTSLSLTHLALADNRFSIQDLGALLSAASMCSIRSLDLSSAVWGDQIVEPLAGVLARLTSLRLVDIGLTFEGLLPLLRDPLALTKLDLSSNRIGPEGALAIATRGVLPALEMLRLDDIGGARLSDFTRRLDLPSLVDVSLEGRSLPEATTAKRQTSLTFIHTE